MITPERPCPSPSELPTQFLLLAAEICSREVEALKIWSSGNNLYRWLPSDQTFFSQPIALDRIEVTAHPKIRPDFSVVSAVFHILGNEEMKHSVSANDSRPGTVDPWSKMIYETFSEVYRSHSHYRCIRDLRLKRTEEKRRDRIKAIDKLTEADRGYIVTVR